MQTPDVESMRASVLPIAPVLKRRRDSMEDNAVLFQEEDGNSVDLRNELKRLRQEVQEKDRRLEELERIVAGLQQAMPPAATTQG